MNIKNQKPLVVEIVMKSGYYLQIIVDDKDLMKGACLEAPSTNIGSVGVFVEKKYESLEK